MGESIWAPSTQVKKEHPCLYPISNGRFDYIWPSLEPHGFIPYQIYNPNLVNISIAILKWLEIINSEEHKKRKYIKSRIYI